MVQTLSKSQNTIDVLTEILNNLPPSSTASIYQIAKAEIEKDVFTLLKYQNLFKEETQINLKDYFRLMDTLRILNNSEFVTLSEAQKKSIQQHPIYTTLIQILDKKINELSPGSDIREIIKQINENPYVVTEGQTIDQINNIVSKYIIPSTTILELFKAITQEINRLSALNLSNTSQTENKKNSQKETGKGLTEEEIQTLLQQYNCDISKANEKLRKEFPKKGNFQNIVDIIKWCNENNIPFDIEKYEYCYLALCSNTAILNEMKEILNDEKHKLDFTQVLRKVPAAFGNKYSVIVNHTNGCFEHFKQNIELISQLGYDAKKIITAPSSLIASAATTGHNIEVLKQYGYSNLAGINFALSSLKARNIQLILDQLIERGKLEEFMTKQSSRIGQFADISRYLIQSGEITEKETYKSTIFDEQIDSEMEQTIDKQEISTTTITSNYSDEQIDELEQFRNSERTYLFSKDNQSALISIMKVKTIYPILLQAYPELDRDKLLLFAITYKSMLTKDQFDMIRGIILKEKTL